MILWLGLLLSPVALAGSDLMLLQQDLTNANQVIAETETELQSTLRVYDQQAIRNVGLRLRELKRRRDKIVHDITQAEATQRRNEAGALLHQRPEIQHRLEVIEPQVDKATAAFDETPTPRRGANLSDLTVREIDLRHKLETANRAARKGPAAADVKPAPTDSRTGRVPP
ncbi:hypothetical protein THSYN_26430 [Candidatus Thiodictyon syntrophicum]|jgi:hypothetical protein|uniref:Uncharacterized protein n=2 Tax=Candidatus Thiodictyon syntrophicum TaxID=1166950 RepID=A0A2K8UEW4_9GAMM|nr:hypothetical protein THSYN_26430 [Candidatus Thiodictyon syntrophicum]